PPARLPGRPPGVCAPRHAAGRNALDILRRRGQDWAKGTAPPALPRPLPPPVAAPPTLLLARPPPGGSMSLRRTLLAFGLPALLALAPPGRAAGPPARKVRSAPLHERIDLLIEARK